MYSKNSFTFGTINLDICNNILNLSSFDPTIMKLYSVHDADSFR